MYIAERAVFELDAKAIRLLEIAPGFALESGILVQMSFRPAIADGLETMVTELFRE